MLIAMGLSLLPFRLKGPSQKTCMCIYILTHIHTLTFTSLFMNVSVDIITIYSCINLPMYLFTSVLSSYIEFTHYHEFTLMPSAPVHQFWALASRAGLSTALVWILPSPCSGSGSPPWAALTMRMPSSLHLPPSSSASQQGLPLLRL